MFGDHVLHAAFDFSPVLLDRDEQGWCRKHDQWIFPLEIFCH